MKGVVFLGDRKLALREFPDPILGPRDVIFEIKASGMCGSDLHIYRAPLPRPDEPGSDKFLNQFKLLDELVRAASSGRLG